MSKRAFSRAFDMPTIDPDKEDETSFDSHIEHLKAHIRASAMDYSSDKPCPVVAKLGCDHSWTSYTGLSESFEYCTICDEKR